VALGVTVPWHAGPNVLEQAEAALAAPGPGQVLEERVTIRSQVTTAPRVLPFHVGIWIDGGSPHRYRATFDWPRRAEYGSVLGRSSGLSYAAADDVLDPAAFSAPIGQADLDPAAFVRRAIADGRAKTEGTTMLGGRSILKILLTSRFSGAAIARYFVDAHTYRPVRIGILGGARDPYRIGFPLAPFAFAAGRVVLGFGPTDGPYALVCDFDRYVYLPRTAANRKLPDIQTMHPRAPIV
jgi:hypothetical protein